MNSVRAYDDPDSRPSNPLAKPGGMILLLCILLSLIALVAGIDTIPGALILALSIATVVVSLIVSVPITAQVLVGKLLGFEIRSFNAGPIQIIRDHRVNLEAVDSWFALFRYEFIVPAYRLSYPRLRMLIYLIAGSLACILMLVVSFLALAIAVEASVRNLGVVCSLLGLTIAALILLMWTGLQVLLFLAWLLRGHTHDQPLIAGLDLRWLDIDRLRPRDWDPDLLDRSRWPSRPGTDITSWLNAYYREMDRGRSGDAVKYIDRIVSSISPTPQFHRDPKVIPEIAFTFAHIRENPALARIWLEHSRPHPRARHIRLRAEAAILLAEGQFPEALDRAKEALLFASERASPGLAKAEREWIEGIIAEAESGLSRLAESS